MAKLKSIELHMSTGNVINLVDEALEVYKSSIDKNNGNFIEETLVFGNDDNLTSEIIYTNHIAFVKFNY